MRRLLHAEGGFGQLRWGRARPFSLGIWSIKYGLISYLNLTHFLMLSRASAVDNVDFYGLVYFNGFIIKLKICGPPEKYSSSLTRRNRLQLP